MQVQQASWSTRDIVRRKVKSRQLLFSPLSLNLMLATLPVQPRYLNRHLIRAQHHIFHARLVKMFASPPISALHLHPMLRSAAGPPFTAPLRIADRVPHPRSRLVLLQEVVQYCGFRSRRHNTCT